MSTLAEHICGGHFEGSGATSIFLLVSRLGWLKLACVVCNIDLHLWNTPQLLTLGFVILFSVSSAVVIRETDGQHRNSIFL